MRIIEKDIQFYIQKMKLGEHFSIAGYSDAEWFCMVKHRLKQTSGLGQIFSGPHGDLLTDIIKRRQHEEDFLFAVPKCLSKIYPLRDGGMEAFLKENKIQNFVAYERDIVTDDLAEAAGLHPLISQLKKMPVRIIGNKYLRGINFLNYEHFTEISSPNCHMEEHGIEKAVQDVLGYGIPGVYLVSAGVSAAVIIDRLHHQIPNSWFIDCASIWDAFVGIGRQRGWRAKIYRDANKHQEWIDANLTGTKYTQ